MRPHSPLTYFIDRSLGTKDVPAAIRLGLQAGEVVHVHDDLFEQDAPDTTWLQHVGDHGWVALTKDDAIRRRPIEMAALRAAGTAAFIFGAGQVRGETIGLAFRIALPRIRRASARFDVPIVGRVNQQGNVSLMLIAGIEQKPARPVK